MLISTNVRYAKGGGPPNPFREHDESRALKAGLGDRGDLARKIAMEIVTNSEEGHDLDAFRDVLEDSLLKLSHDQEGAAWIEEYLGRPREHAWPRLPMEFEDPYFDIALVIGRDPDDSGEHADEVLKRVDNFDEDRVVGLSSCSRGDPFFFAGSDHTNTSRAGCGILAHRLLRWGMKLSRNNFIRLWIRTEVPLLLRGVSELVKPLLDETLWHHVHHGDLRWILPVPEVKAEVNRANAVKGWYSNPTALPFVFDSREFPFARFLLECIRSGSMRNRRRLGKIFKQFKVLWEAMGTTLE
ncbi:hypothetical protein DFH09DRAFT_1095094 [Mycena vulgaris]|nr:hypothetical protein DFH09DRAFT_1095094 [Mycena vulgaris]